MQQCKVILFYELSVKSYCALWYYNQHVNFHMIFVFVVSAVTCFFGLRCVFIYIHDFIPFYGKGRAYFPAFLAHLSQKLIGPASVRRHCRPNFQT